MLLRRVFVLTHQIRAAVVKRPLDLRASPFTHDLTPCPILPNTELRKSERGNP